jgi:predicted ATPase
VLIEGSAGTGRTRLLEELLARARLDGAAIAEVRASPADQATPWSGVFGLGRGGLLAAPGLAASPPAALATFASRIEDWADRFPTSRQAAPLDPSPALVDVVRAIAADQPVMIAIDDAHWLDPESLRALHALLRDLATRPVLVAMTATAQPPREEIDLLRSRIGRDVTGLAITLQPLGAESLRRLVTWAMPSYDAASADRLARRIASDSAGLPLLAVELLHAVALGLDIGDAAHSWPEPQRTLDQTRPGDLPTAVVAAIRMGFRRLSRDAQTTLAATAVLGERTDAGRLATVTGIEPGALAAALDEAEWERWIDSDGRGYGFVARVAREVVATDLVTAGQRRRFLERSL